MDSYVLKDKELKRSLNLNIFAYSLGIVFFTIFGNPVGSSLFTGFMRKLGAGDLVYSIVMALPVLGGVMQVFGSYFLETTGKRKLLFLVSGFVHRLLWIPVALIPLIFGSANRQAEIIVITVIITVSSISNSVSGIAFNSWMGDLVPLDIAGRFFSRRSLITTISGGVAGLIVSAYVDRVNNFNGFAIIFIIGSIFGVGDIATFFFIRHPPFKFSENRPSLKDIIVEPFKNKNYLKLVIFTSVFYFSVNVSGPFFNVYMIENLKMDYLAITVSTQIMSAITTILFVQKWGSLADKFGYKPILLITGYGIILCPAIFIFTSPGHVAMAYVSNLLSGLVWSGFNVAIFNQSVWLAPERSRSSHIACFTLFTSVFGTAFGYICGGYFLQYAGPAINMLNLPFLMGYSLNAYQVLFAISTIMRLLALIIFLPMIKEDKAKPAGELIHDVINSAKEKFIGA